MQGAWQGAAVAALSEPSPPVALYAAFEALLTRRWAADAMFLTFLETERLAADGALRPSLNADLADESCT